MLVVLVSQDFPKENYLLLGTVNFYNGENVCCYSANLVKVTSVYKGELYTSYFTTPAEGHEYEKEFMASTDIQLLELLECFTSHQSTLKKSSAFSSYLLQACPVDISVSSC